MKLLLDSFWRAAAYLMRPRVIGLTLLPLLIAGGLFLVMGYFFWEPAVSAVRAQLENWALTEAVLRWMDTYVGASFRAVMAPMIIVALAVPVAVVMSLLLVALLMMPALVSLVAERRFPALERKRGGQLWESAWRSGLFTLVAMVALILTVPLWLVPPLALVIPPMIWGWLTAQVMTYDALSEHASLEERLSLQREHRWPLLLIGLISGFLGAAPSLIWAVSAMALILAPLLIAVSIWLYTLVFAFSCLWFVHYLLAALQRARVQAGDPASAGPVILPAEPGSAQG
ncbi:EI24 domain-containing protein [Ideonella oryzae]|uniref:EI24 domain-containing protein n=1 Tax=Ideonella oryzae TaxID=2937441 RepID=A0ABT1BKB7_9BURK|nr:EI24 domain-containing protein [Ideonella oryzae]MCO5976650.1 EI24 domain-containing protein [Ideonella oryzae]